MKIEDVVLESHKFECENMNKKIDFILVSESNYVSLKREMLSLMDYGFYENDILPWSKEPWVSQ